jgi:hypothetical protein
MRPWKALDRLRSEAETDSWTFRDGRASARIARYPCAAIRVSGAWALLGSNQWPLPCERESDTTGYERSPPITQGWRDSHHGLSTVIDGHRWLSCGRGVAAVEPVGSGYDVTTHPGIPCCQGCSISRTSVLRAISSTEPISFRASKRVFPTRRSTQPARRR